jgi:hypothetical protein
MADNAATNVANPAGNLAATITGTASADTVPAGSIVLWRNTGAGSHTVTLTTNNTVDGLAVADMVITVVNGTQQVGRVPPQWGDANGRVAVAINGTAAEVLYTIMGGA